MCVTKTDLNHRIYIYIYIYISSFFAESYDWLLRFIIWELLLESSLFHLVKQKFLSAENKWSRHSFYVWSVYFLYFILFSAVITIAEFLVLSFVCFTSFILCVILLLPVWTSVILSLFFVNFILFSPPLNIVSVYTTCFFLYILSLYLQFFVLLQTVVVF